MLRPACAICSRVSSRRNDAAVKVQQQQKTVIWFVWFVLFIWLNKINQINQINQINKTNQIIQANQYSGELILDCGLIQRSLRSPSRATSGCVCISNPVYLTHEATTIPWGLAHMLAGIP